VGDFEASLQGDVESPMEYHSAKILILTRGRNPVGGQCLVGSLTGAVASKRATEAFTKVL
jgi:hypothetical protein